jgi:hypothetical protein
MTRVDPHADTVEQYRDFGRDAVTESPCFAEWCDGVVGDDEVLAWLADLPPIKQQPNLVFAAARWHGVRAPGPYAGLRDALLGDDGTIRATILERSTQTNEVGRLATLTPAFSMLGSEPLALLEVGASAGLCLYPDRYSYAWHTDDGDTVLLGIGPPLDCRVKGDFTAPLRLPDVAWRGGVDLNPLDVTDDDAMSWLATLVWPEHDERRERLLAAIDVARTDPPALQRGDLLEEVPRLVDEAGQRGRVVVFHSAVIAYLEDSDRRRFHRMMSGLVAEGRCHWVSNEAKQVLPHVTATGPQVPESHRTFVLGVDGRAVAWTHGHGRSMRWFGQDA